MLLHSSFPEHLFILSILHVFAVSSLTAPAWMLHPAQAPRTSTPHYKAASAGCFPFLLGETPCGVAGGNVLLVYAIKFI